MLIYYSGHAGGQRHQDKDWEPEVVLGKEANVMVSYIDFAKRSKPNKRFRTILMCRVKGKRHGR
jgi:hypothetical protein